MKKLECLTAKPKTKSEKNGKANDNFACARAKYLKLLKNKTSYRKGQPAAQQVVSGLLGI